MFVYLKAKDEFKLLKSEIQSFFLFFLDSKYDKIQLNELEFLRKIFQKDLLKFF